MAPARQKKQSPIQLTASPSKWHGATGSSKVPLHSPSTPPKSALKRQRMGVSIQQKQALIDNLQLEVTERARRLRAQYGLQAQGLRSRIEIRINRIPTSLRRAKMGDLLAKYLDQEQKRLASSRPPAVPAKDAPQKSPQKNLQRSPPGVARPLTASHYTGMRQVFGEARPNANTVLISWQQAGG
ncbi:hypothetical protein RJ55_00391 [Drechmeria coniospora]|nr:hypothetical protein RJ55_00391 [Drechmeria coniospora]